MRASTTVFAVVLTLLLGAIAYELHQVNQHLAWVSGPIKGLAAAGAASMAATKAETREERIARRVRDIQESSDETAEVLRRALSGPTGTGSATKPPSPTPRQPKAPRP